MPREVGAWTRNKLQILSSYLPLYLQATAKALDRVYIDGFAGPGTNILRHSGEVIDGSPLIALNARGPTKGTAFTHLYFIDQDETTLAELKETVEARGLGRRVTFLRGDVNLELPKVVRQLHRKAPTFVLLDTVGIEPRWTTIEAISSWKTELLITFPFGMAINRNRTSPKVRAYFGTDEYQPLLGARGPGRPREILDLYKHRLRELGYSHMIPNDLLVTTRRNARLYHLIFASKVKIGPSIMNWVVKQPDAYGQQQMDIGHS